MARPKKITSTKQNYFDKLEGEIKSNQSTLSLVLGALIIIVLGVLIFNYFNRGKADLGPAQQQTDETDEKQGDVSPESLPGKYTVKEGDTLFTIAEKYYKDGYKFGEIAKANNIASADNIEVGQVLEIPKLETPAASPKAEATPEAQASPSPEDKGTGGATNVTAWGTKIEGNTYTVVAGDWLSTIAGRAYGDIYAYEKIAKANNLTNPDLIEPGMVLKLPR